MTNEKQEVMVLLFEDKAWEGFPVHIQLWQYPFTGEELKLVNGRIIQ